MRWLDSITNSMDMNLHKLQEIVSDKDAQCAAVHRVSELDATWQLNNNMVVLFFLVFFKVFYSLEFGFLESLSITIMFVVVVVSVTKSCPNLRGPIDHSILVSLSFTVSWSFLKFKSIELVMLSNTSSSALPSPFAFNLSQHQGLFQ